MKTHRTISPRATGALKTLGALLALSSPAFAESLTAEQALDRATRHSPELQAAIAELEATKIAVRIEDRARVAVLTANLQGSYSESFSDTAEGATLNSSQGISGDISIRSTTRIGTTLQGGLSSNMRWQTVNRDPSTSESVTLGPSTSAEVFFQVNQPFLRGGGSAYNLASWRTAKTQAQVAELSQQEGVSNYALSVLQAYWDLWVAERSLEVERAAAAVTSRQLQDIQARFRLGSVPELDVLRLSTEEAKRKQQILESEATLRDRQLTLGRMLGLDRASSSQLQTSSTPRSTFSYATEDQTLRAVADRSPELATLQGNIDRAKESLSSARNAALARLDGFVRVGAGGLWNESSDGLALPGGRPAFSASGGLTFELPLSASQADARLEQAQASLLAAELRLQNREETLVVEVARIRQQLDTAIQGIATAEISLEVATKLAAKEDARLKLGTALISDLISAQQSQREAELSLLRAKAEAEKLIMQLDHLTGALLTRVNTETTR